MHCRSPCLQARDHSEKASQRILLVYDEKGQIVGKLSPMDVVQGLEPNYENIDSLSRYHLAQRTLESMKEHLRFWQEPLADLCKKAYSMKIDGLVKSRHPG